MSSARATPAAIRRKVKKTLMKPSNLVILMSDEHTRRITGCYGHSKVLTPNIDSIAARGVRFENAYCNSPICVPSRASFVTGRYVHKTGNWDNAAPYTGATPGWGHRLTDQSIPLTIIGKMHFRSVEDENGFPDERLIMDVKDGVGDLFGIARQSMPPQGHMVENVRNAGAGETDHTRFDTAVAGEAVRWIETEAGLRGEPWCLWVSLVTPHFPYVAPQEYFDLYPVDEVEWPINGSASAWPDHPMMEIMRRLSMPIPGGEFDEETVRRAIAAYYGLVTFTDRQIGRVLDALEIAGLTESTRIMYTSDHGEMLGDFGKWGKSCMYESSAAVPLIAAGPEIPEAKVVEEPVSLVDCYPAILEAVGARREPADHDLPGTSLWEFVTGAGPVRNEPVFSEYHAVYSPCAQYMLRDSRYKYVHYTGGYPPQLFDMSDDPLEQRDRGQDPKFGEVVAEFESQLRRILDPDEVDRQAQADQAARLEAHGGAEKILGEGLKINFSPVPDEYQ